MVYAVGGLRNEALDLRGVTPAIGWKAFKRGSSGAKLVGVPCDEMNAVD